VSDFEEKHTAEKCPFGLTIPTLVCDVSEIKKALIGDAKGSMGLAAKVNIMWWVVMVIGACLLVQVSPALARIIGIG